MASAPLLSLHYLLESAPVQTLNSLKNPSLWFCLLWDPRLIMEPVHTLKLSLSKARLVKGPSGDAAFHRFPPRAHGRYSEPRQRQRIVYFEQQQHIVTQRTMMSYEKWLIFRLLLYESQRYMNTVFQQRVMWKKSTSDPLKASAATFSEGSKIISICPDATVTKCILKA